MNKLFPFARVFKWYCIQISKIGAQYQRWDMDMSTIINKIIFFVIHQRISW